MARGRGRLLGALTAAGAFAAFMSTCSGPLVSIAGTTSYDLWQRSRGPVAPAVRWQRYRLAAAVGMALAMVAALAVRRIDIGVLAGWAFALAASTFCPLFVLGIWWPRLTATGAAAGMIAGGAVASPAILGGFIVGAPNLNGTLDALLTQPAIVSVPIAFASMVLVSLLTAAPQDVGAQMLALHAPEGLGLEELERARA